MAEKVTIPADLREKLAGANGDAVPLCDETGNVVGYYLSPELMSRREEERKAVAAWLDRLWTPDEIARIVERSKKDSRPKRTMEEVLKLVEGE
jgi:hypothetical protein